MNHIIKKQILSIDLPSGHDSWRIQDQLKETFHREVIPRLEQICDELDINKQVTLRLDKLSINVGSISKEEIESIWVQEVEKSFREELLRYKKEKSDNDTSVNLMTPEESSLNIFMSLLEKGALPWWVSEGYNESPQNLLAKLLQEQPASLVARIKESKYKSVISKRLFLQFQKSSVTELLNHFEKPKSSEALSWITRLCKKEFRSEFKTLKDTFLLIQIGTSIDSSLASTNNQQFFELLFQRIQEDKKESAETALIKFHKHLINREKNTQKEKSLQYKKYAPAATEILASILNSFGASIQEEHEAVVLAKPTSDKHSEAVPESETSNISPLTKDDSGIESHEKHETPSSTRDNERSSKKGSDAPEIKNSVEHESRPIDSNMNLPVFKETNKIAPPVKDNIESLEQEPGDQNPEASGQKPIDQDKTETRHQNSEGSGNQHFGREQKGIRSQQPEKSAEQLSGEDQRVWEHIERIKKLQAKQDADKPEGSNNEGQNLESDSQPISEINEESQPSLGHEKISDPEQDTNQQTRQQEASDPIHGKEPAGLTPDSIKKKTEPLSPDQTNKQRKEQQLNSLKYWQEELESIDECYIQNAGLILLWPYLGHFFNDFGLLSDGDFKNQSDQKQAALVLQYLVKTEPELLEYKLPLNKLLCGLSISEPLSDELIMTADDLLKCNTLLEATIQNWTALRGTSPAGFQSSFINRNGVLKKHDNHWVLQVEKMPFDMLMEQLPWPISIVRLSWMNKPIYVEW